MPHLSESHMKLEPVVGRLDRTALTDVHHRSMRKLRVSLTDACNFRCFYCMPNGQSFLPHEDLLGADELLRITSHLVDLGISQVRVTGGEPTLRPDFAAVMRAFSTLKLEKLGLTTNALHLDHHLDLLEETGCKHINISLDSLSSATFERLTKQRTCEKVIANACLARKRGFHVKVNTVLFKGINDHEIFDFLRFAEREDIEVRFLELMRIGPAHKENEAYFIDADTVIKRLRDAGEILTPVQTARDATAFVFKTKTNGRVGFIASESKPFCSSCSRLRLSPKGRLRACLMSEEGVELKNVPREKLPTILQGLLQHKPMERIHHVDEPMFQIGG
jgi:GTP 3',8-cyclase